MVSSLLWRTSIYIFILLWKRINRNIELKICVSKRIIFFGGCWETSLDVIRLKPGVLCHANFCIVYFTSLGRRCLGSRLIESGQVKNWLTFVIWLEKRILVCGLNLESRWWRNILDLSESFMAQIPSGFFKGGGLGVDYGGFFW